MSYDFHTVWGEPELLEPVENIKLSQPSDNISARVVTTQQPSVTTMGLQPETETTATQMQTYQKREMVVAVGGLLVCAFVVNYLDRLHSRIKTLEMLMLQRM